MDNEQLVKSWHEAIITECRKRLGRNMTMEEDAFITSRGGPYAPGLCGGTDGAACSPQAWSP